MAQSLGLRVSSTGFNWFGRSEKWLNDPAGQYYYILPDGSFYKWNNAPPPNALAGAFLGKLDPAYYDNPGWLANAQAGQYVVAPGSLQKAIELDCIHDFNGTVQIDANGRKWLNSSIYIAANGDMIRTSPNSAALLGSLDRIFYVRPTLLANASGSASVNLAFDLDRTLGLWSDGNYRQNKWGRNEKWIMGNGGSWYYIDPQGRLFRDTGVQTATLDSSFWVNPGLLSEAYTSRTIISLTAAEGYRDDDILLGGDGNDTLAGGAGGNLQIGGLGVDYLAAGLSGDILIGGTTAMDANTTELKDILAECTRTDLAGAAATVYQQKTHSLRSSTCLRPALSALNVLEDGAVDRLFGSPGGLSWFWGGKDTLSRSSQEKVQ